LIICVKESLSVARRSFDTVPLLIQVENVINTALLYSEAIENYYRDNCQVG
jgi:hypothetical protein